MLSRAKQIFQKHPLLMNMTSYGTIYVSAEISQQTIQCITSADKTAIDWTSVGRFATVGIGGIAPVLYTWYKCLDYLLPAATGATVATKVAADLIFCNPTTITIFFTGKLSQNVFCCCCTQFSGVTWKKLFYEKFNNIKKLSAVDIIILLARPLWSFSRLSGVFLSRLRRCLLIGCCGGWFPVDGRVQEGFCCFCMSFLKMS
ncbi:mpv17-like protein [Nephila pilipes]|uniref:Mpv17-like protein n=1 Tax=Nephila pilipes TaxID=299642 RepID=A0A8X6PGA3_NEPPI|nr:mpv17-like protein [Nephila pilipes]